jgi:hypothetical protein
MKKYIFIYAVIWIITLDSYSQAVFYDALRIKNNCTSVTEASFLFKGDPQAVSELSAILRNYLPGQFKDSTLTEAQVLDFFSDNPFWGNQITDLENGAARAEDAKIISSAVSSLGSLDVTSFTDKLAKFIVARTKQELSTSFFERFKADLDSIKQIRLLFPSTYNALKAIDKEIYNYPAYLDLLRESFQKDLTFILPDLEKLVRDKSMDIVFTNYPQIRIILSDALYIVNEFSEGKHPGEIIHNYITGKANKDSLSKIEANIYPALQALDLFSQSLRSKQSGQYWISPDSIKLLFVDNTIIHLYLGLIYQQATLTEPEIKFGETEFVTILKNFQTNTEPFQDYLTTLISRGRNANYYFSVIKEKQLDENDKPNYQDYYSLYDATLNVLESLVQIPIPHADKFDITKLDDYFSAAKSVGNIYVDVYEKQYNSAVVELSNIYSNLLLEKIKGDIAAIEDQLKQAGDNAIKSKLKIKKAGLEKIQKAGSLLLKYGTFAATISSAENNSDMQTAIEAIALPVGSARIKRESDFNVSINAYCGLFGGMEKIKGVDDGYKVNTFGAIAPLGISISTGKSKFLFMPCKRDGHFSHTVFLSLIDIGALSAFRFTDDSTTSAPNIQLKDIISPGIFYSLGIPKSPLSVNIGFQLGPLLRKVTAVTNTYSDKYTRFSISLCADIPLLNLYNSNK